MFILILCIICSLASSAIQRCIDALRRQQQTSSLVHIPFRDSKLTRVVLQNCVGVNNSKGRNASGAKTLILLNISPCTKHMQDSINSLRFGSVCASLKPRIIRRNTGIIEQAITGYAWTFCGKEAEK